MMLTDYHNDINQECSHLPLQSISAQKFKYIPGARMNSLLEVNTWSYLNGGKEINAWAFIQGNEISTQ